MNFKDILVQRACPSCAGKDAEIIFHLNKDQFLYNNPTHNIAWFETLDIPSGHKFPFVRCSNCEFVYSQFRLNDEFNFLFYNEGVNIESSKDKVFKKSKRIFQVQIWLNLLRWSEEKNILKVLDFGGGWGDFLAIAKSYGVDIYGLEFDTRKIAYAKTQNIPLHDMAFINEHAPYDIFMCNQVLEHLDDPKGALRHLHSLLNKKAVGFVGVPNFNESYLKDNIKIIGGGGVPPKEINPFGHLNYFSPRTFIRMLGETGFEVFTPGTKSRKKSLAEKMKAMLNPGGNAAQTDSTLLYVKAV
jgi:2-polyprenyl-3-methyl-5-hydroxy-6-metoxy-1,4-benzoquinol methylase